MKISDQRHDLRSTDLSGFEVQWQARIENRCNAAYDLDLTVHFLDAAGQSIYRTPGWAKLQVGQTVEVGKRLYMPSRYAEELSAIEVRARKREREY